MDLLHALELTRIGTVVRESLYGFPILVGAHILGLGLSVGALLWFDLRLLGAVLPSVPVTRVYRQVIPWASAGFCVMFSTGALLFTGYASSAFVNPYFRIKMAALGLAALNAAFYHVVTERNVRLWEAGTPPSAARLAGVVSIVLWATVIVCGRLMAYTMY